MATVTPIRRTPTAPQLDAENLATGYLFQVRWESRHAALSYCTRQLVAYHGMSEATAEREALQAYAALEGVNQRLRVDIDASTSALVMLQDREGRSIALTVTDLRHLLDQLRRKACLPRIDDDRHESAHLLEH
jgi:hypothetical protein